MQEVRFAVVLYGGVSLAIYINGVAQELLDMVRATAVGTSGRLVYTDDKHSASDKKLSAAGRIYRRIGKFLNSRKPDDSMLQPLNPEAPEAHPAHPAHTERVRTKFVVDVISGTSAGGLNGIFLGKALANDQSMSPLQDLWMTEGDLGKLLNDGKSVENEPALDPAKVKRPESLLNSERMYEKLLTALHGMDFPLGGRSTSPDATRAGRNQCEPSPLVEELDVFVTATDIAGLPIRIQLANAVAEETRHRNVFRFRYCSEKATGKKHDDFGVTCNPFLAFAGRCTSSFPFAFEPMRLGDIWRVLGYWRAYGLGKDAYLSEWEGRHFFEDYTKGKSGDDLAKSKADFENRSFGDGGYLDNKPFTYATRTLMRRRAVCPVKRKLLYVEPAPDPMLADNGGGERPGVIANVTAALLTLPRHETIHDDLQDILTRNRLFRQLSGITENLEEDIKNRPAQRQEGVRYEQTSLSELTKHHGVFYGTYHRLKVDEVTADLASIFAGAFGFDPGSDEREALYGILRMWREEKYSADGPGASATDGRNYESHFLLSFDIGYRLRRLFLLQARINDLAAVAASETVRNQLRTIKEAVAEGVTILRSAEHTMQRDADGHIFAPLVEARHGRSAAQSTKVVRAMLFAAVKDKERARRMAHKYAPLIGAIVDHISVFLSGVFKEVSGKIMQVLPDIPACIVSDDPETKALQKIARLYHEFEWYDMVIFPMQQGTDAAESNRVEIIRISPLDSENLIRRDVSRKKLAGTALWAFGAFLARKWRDNDMLWGKLDAAEALIRNLLSDDPRAKPKTVDALVDEMHTAILNESISEDMRDEARDLICAAIAADPHGVSKEQAVRELISRLDDLDEHLKKLLRCCLGEKDLLDYFKTKYEVNRGLEPKNTLRLLGRAARVVGKMSEVLSDGSRFTPQAKFFSRLASGMWAIIEISVPRSFAWNEARHIRALFYVIGIVLVILGMFWHPAAAPGAVILAATLTLHVFTAWLHGLMQARENEKNAVGRWLLIGIATVIVGLASWKAIELANRFQRWATGSTAEDTTRPPHGSHGRGHP